MFIFSPITRTGYLGTDTYIAGGHSGGSGVNTTTKFSYSNTITTIGAQSPTQYCMQGGYGGSVAPQFWMFGGYSGSSNVHTSVYSWTPGSIATQFTQSTQTGVRSTGGAVVSPAEGQFVGFGGSTAVPATNNSYNTWITSYDATSNTSAALSVSNSSPAWSGGATKLGANNGIPIFYTFGGFTGTTPALSTSIQKYDYGASSSTVSTVTTLTNATALGSVGSYRGKAYIFGGRGGNYVQSYDGTTVSSVSNLSTQNTRASTTSSAERIMIFGGCRTSPDTNNGAPLSGTNATTSIQMFNGSFSNTAYALPANNIHGCAMPLAAVGTL